MQWKAERIHTDTIQPGMEEGLPWDSCGGSKSSFHLEMILRWNPVCSKAARRSLPCSALDPPLFLLSSAAQLEAHRSVCVPGSALGTPSLRVEMSEIQILCKMGPERGIMMSSNNFPSYLNYCRRLRHLRKT